MMMFIVVFLLLPFVSALEFPFNLSRLFSWGVVHSSYPTVKPTPRIAIIGAGAGGTSAAFWISKAKERFGLDVEVDVYESSDYIGGRSTVVYPYNNRSLPELELGSSIFGKSNRNIWRASDEFALTHRTFHDENYETGIWNGKDLFLSFSGSWWDTAKLIWRYGILSPKRTEDIVRTSVNRMMDFYSPDFPKWDNISDLSSFFHWDQLTNSTAADYFKSQGISDKYIFEVVQAATRVNYYQNADEVHALAGAVAMATSDARRIAGGSYQIFEQFLKHSGANIYLNTKVKDITPSSSSSWTLKSTRGATEYRAVILAAPFHSTHITVPRSIYNQIPEQPYQQIHVTLLSTTSPHPNSAYFGFSEGVNMPRVLLTTKNSAAQPEFNSLSYHGLIREGEWAVKIISDQKISNEWLDNMFNGQVKWLLRKQWDAYPKLSPTTKFPPIKLDRGFYYVNAFEPLIYTMETQTLSSRNVIDLLLQDEFNSGICRESMPPSSEEDLQKVLLATSNSSKASEDFVYGFDC